jgi:sugar lactone lactonase YvrE
MEPRRIIAEIFRQDGCILGEGPFWFNHRLWWVDIEQGLLLAADESGNLAGRWELGQRIGSAVPIDSDTFVVALQNGLARLHLASGERLLIPESSPPSAGHRFNDGKCDPVGRLIVGTLMLNGERGRATLHACETGKPFQILRKGLSLSNGLAWSQDGATLYHIDTLHRSVFAYDYDLTKGGISRERTLLTFQEQDGLPDGMTIDREGRLWIAFWDGWAVQCYRPSDGACVAEVSIPCARPTSCCFGGARMDRLFVTTARQGLTPEDLAQQPLAGSLFVCDPGTSGFCTSLFL